MGLGEVENRQRLAKSIRLRIDQHYVALPIQVCLSVRVQLVKVGLRQAVLGRCIRFRRIQQLPFCVEYQPIAVSITD